MKINVKDRYGCVGVIGDDIHDVIVIDSYYYNSMRNINPRHEYGFTYHLLSVSSDFVEVKSVYRGRRIFRVPHSIVWRFVNPVEG